VNISPGGMARPRACVNGARYDTISILESALRS
jgi:hypothetical protein